MTDTPHASSAPSPDPLPPEGSDASGYPFTFYLPDLGEGLRSGEIIEWLISEGQQVELDQVLVVVETAKSTVEIPSPVAGVVVRLLEPVGQVVDVDAPLIELCTPTPQTQAPTAGAETPAKDSADKLPAKPGVGESKHLVGRGKMPIKPGGTGTALPPKSAKTQGGKARSGAKVSPAVRRLARSLGVDLKTVTGTGAGGAITPEDVQTAADHAAGGAS